MAMQITNNYNNVYENTYAQASKKEETEETSAAKKNSGTGSSSAYFKELEKLAPSVDFRVGNTFSSAKSGKTLTINPKLLEKMQNDPKQEKETMDMIKGVESMTNLMDGIYKASGWKVVYRHSYIDENGKYRAIAYVRNEFMYNMSDKLREERRQNAKDLIEKTKEKAAKKLEELQGAQEKSEEKKAEEKKTEENEKTGKLEKFIEEKIADSKDGMIYMDDADFREIMEAMQDSADSNKVNTKKQPAVGANFDLQI